MPYGYSKAVWDGLTAQERLNEVENFDRNERGGRPYNLPDFFDDSGSRDYLWGPTPWKNPATPATPAGWPVPLLLLGLAGLGVMLAQRRRR